MRRSAKLSHYIPIAYSRCEEEGFFLCTAFVRRFFPECSQLKEIELIIDTEPFSGAICVLMVNCSNGLEWKRRDDDDQDSWQDTYATMERWILKEFSHLLINREIIEFYVSVK